MLPATVATKTTEAQVSMRTVASTIAPDCTGADAQLGEAFSPLQPKSPSTHGLR